MSKYDDDFDRKDGLETGELIYDGVPADADDDFDDLEISDVGDDLSDLPDDYGSDGRFELVMDELEDLRRDINNGQSIRQPGHYPYAPASHGSGEAALYNEINRLRDELSRTQNSHSLHVEMNRMRDEIERAGRKNDSRMMDEISRLRADLATLSGTARTERAAEKKDAQPAVTAPDIAELNKRIDAVASETRTGSEGLKTELGKRLDTTAQELKAGNEGIRAELDKLSRSVAGLPSLAAITEKLDKLTEAHRPVHKHHGKRARVGRNMPVTDNTEVIRRLIDLKLMMGRMGKDEYERELAALNLYDCLTAAKSAVYSTSCSYTRKLEAMRKLESEINATEGVYVADIVAIYNGLVDELLSRPIGVDGIEAFSRQTGSDKIRSGLSGEIKLSAIRYVTLVAEIEGKNTGFAIDRLPTIVKLKNKLTNDAYAADNEALCNEILSRNSELAVSSEGAAAEKSTAEIDGLISRLCYLPYSEFVTWPHLEYDKMLRMPSSRPVMQEYMDEILQGEEIKTSDDAVTALTSAVNLLRAEIAEGAVLSGSGIDPSALVELREAQKELMDKYDAVGADRAKILADVEHIKEALDAFVDTDVDSVVESENGEISKLLEEVKTLHSEVNTLSESTPAAEGASTPDEVNLFLSEIVSLRDEVQSYKDEVSSVISRLGGAPAQPVVEAADAPAAETDDHVVILDELTGMRADLAGYASDLEAVRAALEELKNDRARTPREQPAAEVVSDKVVPADVYARLDEIKDGIGKDDEKLLAVRDEILAAVGGINARPTVEEGGVDEIKAGIESVKQQLSDLQIYETVGAHGESAPSNGDAVLEEVAALRDMIADLSANITAPASAVSASDMALLKDEIADLKSAVANKNAAGAEVDALRKDVAELKQIVLGMTAGKAETGETAELVRETREDVRKMLAEPDYGVMNEVLALREEFQLLKERMEKSALLSGDAQSDGKLLTEIKSLRDQIFAIDMASVSDGEQQSYESYNNIIVDELGEIKNELTSLLSVSSDGIRIDTRPITDKLEEVRNLVEEARKAADAQRDLAAADEIAKLKQTIADQKDTQNAMLELMNKMIAKLDKQEEQTARLTDEISGTRDESVKKDIEDIKYTLGVMQGAEDKDADADLEESIGKLKAELSQMAGIIGAQGKDKQDK